MRPLLPEARPGPRSVSRRRPLQAATVLFLAACAHATERPLRSDAPILVAPAGSNAQFDLPPVRLPEDEGPHDVLAEWWYYTGHLYPEVGGGELGFELVFFRGVRGERPPGYAAHFAITDIARRRFTFDQRQDVALNETARGQPASGAVTAAGTASTTDTRQTRPAAVFSLPVPGGGFDLAVGGWQMRGRGGNDYLFATLPGYTLDAGLKAVHPPALHVGYPPLAPGLLSFGQAGYSYYYSRTRMDVQGTLEMGGVAMTVRGEAWMDHQWGNFLVLGGGGWDWFAGNLSDGRDITVSVIRDASGTAVTAYGTLVGATGEAQHLEPGSFDVSATDSWTSPRSRVRYPSGWRVRVPSAGLDLLWSPLLEDQELDARTSTGVVYWEGATALHDTATGEDRGRGYVELTGYTALR